MLSQEKIIEVLKETSVMQEGHFLLTSGRHSDKYMQCARLFEYAEYSQMLCEELAKRFEGEKIDLVAGPALGGVIMAYEVSRALGVRNIFAERVDGKMTLRRGFSITPGQRVLLVEDVITTGGSVLELAEVVEANGGVVVGVGLIVDRSNGKIDLGYRTEALLSMEVISYDAEDCPLCKQGLPINKPGSRNVK
ncbi:orotate phosphoribosyltransferase [Clostridia bacterium OttesenSCG-928-F22]|nr:orotate phosphoribosyltransferase [Clostridia bacterium OttesenSCG-928-F22]